MNKNDFIREVAAKANLSLKDTGRVVEAMFATIQETLTKGEKQQFVGFGTFEVRHRAARRVKSPATGEEIILPATKIPAFKAGKNFKEAVASSNQS